MAKLRTNHARQGSGAAGGNIAKVGIFGAILAGLFFIFNQFTGGDDTPEPPQETYQADEYYLPEGGNFEIVSNDFYSLAYDEKNEQAAWVGYVLTRENLSKDWNERIDNFRIDPQISTGSATPADYRGSGYDRGHLVPAADMAWNATAQDLTFQMSNISPQSHHFNIGIWRELEETVRIWANKYEEIYVVTGPILTRKGKGTIGESEVTIPPAYFKVILDLREPEQKGIGFIMPNEISYEPIFKYAYSIDQVEEMTELDFFAELMPDDLENKLESQVNVDLWTFSKKKYDQRVNSWNKN